MRLRPEEWPAPVRGELQMNYWDGTRNSSRRTLRDVALMVRWGTSTVPNIRMADPEWIDVVGGALLMRGMGLHMVDGRVYEHEEVWLIRALESLQSPPLPPFDARPWLKANRLPVGDPPAVYTSAQEHAKISKEPR
ncbi:hypothetical protein LJR118_000309 [Acidovorax sp. LjRoot118]|uniref:hypothetical protein n=1 Tax=Acidovorax sp. LjRoot118 TaxID=3342256 RepID=UPI003ECEACD8